MGLPTQHADPHQCAAKYRAALACHRLLHLIAPHTQNSHLEYLPRACRVGVVEVASVVGGRSEYLTLPAHGVTQRPHSALGQ